jgi:predicted RNA polymerase sigma factor
VQQAVQQALLKVPEVFRSAVILRDLEGMAYEEVAEVLTVTVGTVKSRILRGRRMLREILDPLLRIPHNAQPQAPGPDRRAAVLHSPLFFAAEEHKSSRTDTAGWAHPRKTGDAEGGVAWIAKK